MRLNKIILFAMAVCFLFITSSLAIVVNPPAVVRDFTSAGTYYHSSGNLAYFAVDHTMTFTQVVVDSTYVEFNNTKFNISSPNRINISLEYLDSDMTASAGTTLVSFYAQTTTGNARFNISSFSVGATYEVFKNNVSMVNATANATGFIYFTNSVWTTAYFEIALLSGVLPVVTTNASTGVEETNATLNGYSSISGEIIAEQYSSTDSFGTGINNGFWDAQTFYNSHYFVAVNTSLLLRKTAGTSPGVVTVSLRATAAGVPSGSDLAYGTMDGNSVTTAAAGAWYTIGFNTTVSIIGNTQYAIVVRAASATDSLWWRVKLAGAYANGTRCASVNSGATWSSIAAQDHGFIVNGFMTSYHFEYGLTASYGTITNTYGLTGHHFSQNIAGLTPGQLYHFRSVATNPNGTSYGSDMTLLTKPNEPTALSITDTASGQQTLSWTHGTGYNASVVRGTIGSYPASPQTGTAIQNSSANSVIRNGLTGGDNWYYRVWEYTVYGSSFKFSDTYTQGYLNVLVTPTITTGAASLVEETTATLGGTLVSTGGDATGTVRFQYGLTTAYGTNTSNSVIGAGAFTKAIIGLTPGQRYHFRAYVNNTLFSALGADATFVTKPNAPDTASFTIVSNTRSLGLNWTKATGANTTLIVRKQGAYPLTKTDGTIVYNSTGSSYTNTGLTPGVGYGYRAWSYTVWGTTWQFSDANATACEITKPEGATGGKASVLTIYLNSTMKVRLNWTKGTGANNTIVVRNTNHLPTSWTDGTMIYNGTGISNDIYMPYVPGSTEYYNAWSYAAWIINPHLYEISANATTFVMPGGGLLINCFDENDHHNLTFNVKVSNQSGSKVYENTSCTNTLAINSTLCPQGPNIQVIVSATGYHQRIYTLDIYTGIIYLLNAYLPPETAPGNGTENCELRGYIDSMTITNPAIDAVVTLTYPLEDMISVEIYNASLYGTYGGWIFVASDKYSFTTTSVTINETVLDANTTMARVSYYYNFCEGGVESALYNLRVISESNAPIENAFMQVKRYINSTGTFVDVSSIFTDANGYVNIYLVPNAHYKVFISKTGYSDIIGSDYIPMSPNAYGQTDEKDFKLYRSTISDMWNYITYTIGPDIFDHNTSFDVYFNISCPSGILEWFKMTVTQYNSTTNTWITLWSFNETTMPTGGNLSYNINANGTYGVQCSFKLVGYDSYTFGVPGSGNKLIYTLMMWGNAISNIDNTITNLAGRSPVFVGNVIVGYTALIVTSLLTLILFTFSPKFSGLGLVAVGMVTAWMKGPLNVISNATIGWNVVVIIIILGILVIAWTNMRETGGQT